VKLKWKISKLDDVDEQYRGLYTQAQDGTFILSVDDTEDERVKNLKSAFETVKGDSKKFKDQLQKFEGVDLEKYASLMQSEKDMADNKLKAEGKFDELRAQLETDHKTAVTKLISEHTAALEASNALSASYKKELQGQMVDAGLTNAIALAGGNPAFLLHHAQKRVVVSDEERDGKPTGRLIHKINTKDGQPWSLMDQDTKQMREANYSDLIKEFETNDDFAAAFSVRPSGGTGSPKSTGNPNAGGRGVNLGTLADMDLDQLQAMQDKVKSGEVAVRQ
jgi:hypothetical protein